MTLSDFRLPKRLRGSMRALAQVCCPPKIHEPAVLEAVMREVDLFFRTVPAGERAVLLAGLTTFELSTLPRYGRPFSSLPLSTRERWFHKWWTSRFFLFQQFALGMKVVLAMGYYEAPDVRKALEYNPDAWIAKAARRRFQKWSAAIAEHERMLVAPDPLVRPKTLLRKVHHAEQAA